MFEKLKKWLAPTEEKPQVKLTPTKRKKAEKVSGGYTGPQFSNNDSLPPLGGSSVKPKATRKKLSPKEEATAKGEPYVAVLGIDLDPNNINSGSVNLDWNDKFIVNLIKHGYKFSADDTDNDIIDRWFTFLCKNIAMEVYEQEQADPDKRDSITRVINTKDLGDGYTEVS